jgi:hypothetical protein
VDVGGDDRAGDCPTGSACINEKKLTLSAFFVWWRVIA